MRYAALLIALVAASPAAAAASGQSATTLGRAEAVVIQPIVASALRDLDFGMLTSSRTESGTVTIDPADIAHYSGGARAACLGGGACPGVHASEFAVRGEAMRSYLVGVPASLVASGTLVGSGASAPDLAINMVTVRTQSAPGSGESGSLDVNGDDRFSIGGTLVVPAGTNPAHYRATLTVIVTYS